MAAAAAVVVVAAGAGTVGVAAVDVSVFCTSFRALLPLIICLLSIGLERDAHKEVGY